MPQELRSRRVDVTRYIAKFKINNSTVYLGKTGSVQSRSAARKFGTPEAVSRMMDHKFSAYEFEICGVQTTTLRTYKVSL